ncbi:MAG: hypothetical protein Q9227_009101 [Pyrenula ochraceoflavens]
MLVSWGPRNTQDEDVPVDDLPSWFSDVNAPQKILKFLHSIDFPLSQASRNTAPEDGATNEKSSFLHPSVLDVGTGNGSMLFQLRQGNMTDQDTSSESEQSNDEAATQNTGRSSLGYTGPTYGIDYSASSIELARKIQTSRPNCTDIEFHIMDVITQRPADMEWWPRSRDEGSQAMLFDLVLDKGTFDAVSLSADTVPLNGQDVRHCDVYPQLVSQMVEPGGFLLVTSCNWTEEEVVQWFCPEVSRDEEGTRRLRGQGIRPVENLAVLEVYKKIEYPTFSFGGRKGAGVASVCFKRTR